LSEQNERTHRDFPGREEMFERYKTLPGGPEKDRLKADINELDKRIKVWPLNLKKHVCTANPTDVIVQLSVAAEMMKEEIRQFHVDHMSEGRGEDMAAWNTP
jgi:hypothetical protein